jgi:hypothetical protein
MNIERVIHILAGTMILLSTSLGLLHSQWWFALTLFVGANLFQYGFTNFCPLEIFLKKTGLPTCADAARKCSAAQTDKSA